MGCPLDHPTVGRGPASPQSLRGSSPFPVWMHLGGVPHEPEGGPNQVRSAKAKPVGRPQDPQPGHPGGSTALWTGDTRQRNYGRSGASRKLPIDQRRLTCGGYRGGRWPHNVAQTFLSAVPQVSKPAGPSVNRGHPGRPSAWTGAHRTHLPILLSLCSLGPLWFKLKAPV